MSSRQYRLYGMILRKLRKEITSNIILQIHTNFILILKHIIVKFMIICFLLYEYNYIKNNIYI